MNAIVRQGLRIGTVLGVALGVQAASAAMTLTVEGITPMQPIPEAQALCTPTADGKSAKVSKPLRPAITLSGVPKEAASVAIFVMDPDVPADFTDAGKEGKTLPVDMKRMDFYHYGLVNISPQVTRIIGSDGALDKNPGYPLYIDPANPAHKTTELVNDLGLNDYVSPKSAYGGPCPPWNDERMHHYHFIALALGKDAPEVIDTRSEANGSARPHTAREAFNALIKSKSVLDKATVVGTYTLNAKMRKTAAK